MGLTTWTGMMPKRSDAEYAKNYLNADEIDTLNRIVNLYVDYAELRAKDHKPMYMHDWIEKLDDFLRLSDKELLTHAGTISAKLAKEKAIEEVKQQSVAKGKATKPIEISDEGLETIEWLSLDCSTADKQAPWHSDAEVKIDRLGYVILNGRKTHEFWDATIKCDQKPLRMKVRNICGDETVFVL